MKLRHSLTSLLCIVQMIVYGEPLCIAFDTQKTRQTIHSFGASDCWRVQYVGANWALPKREAIADLLFSMDVDSSQSPKGIGLSLWRFNIGAGTHSASDGADVALHWRRSESMLGEDGSWDNTKQRGQRWFLEAARERGVKYSLGFSISAPYFMTKNGLGHSSEKSHLNLKEDKYEEFAQYLVDVSRELKLDYLSPLNEPQWDWITPNQEGTPATNEEAVRLINCIDKNINRRDKLEVVFGEAGDIRHLYRKSTGVGARDNQIEEVYSRIHKLRSVRDVVVGHSYWSTYPVDTMMVTRRELRGAIDSNVGKSGEYWQTEYCPMETNPDNPKGGWGRDFGMDNALYVARVIHYDLTALDASSWQWWTALSQWDYKDGLIYIDKGDGIGARSNKDPMHETLVHDGEFRTTKTLWALGNFSRFVRPGMVRVECVEGGGNSDILPSAYIGNGGDCTIVIINRSDKEVSVNIDMRELNNRNKGLNIYITDETRNLERVEAESTSKKLPPRSIVTFTTIK